MSYRKIMSIVTEHTSSTVIARYAISLAASCKADLVLYAAHDTGCNEARTVRHMEHLSAAASQLGITVSRIAEKGNIRRLLPKRALAENADLVWYPLMPDERYGTTLKRYTVHHLLRNIVPDLAIVRAITMAKPYPGNMLVPLGKDIGVKGLLPFVAELAGSYHAEITLFHLAVERDTEKIPDDIVLFREQLQQRNIAVLLRSGRGKTGTAVTVEALTRHNDLIVLGRSEHGMMRRVLFGTPAGDIMRQPPCNTILFRAAQ